MEGRKLRACWVVGNVDIILLILSLILLIGCVLYVFGLDFYENNMSSAYLLK